MKRLTPLMLLACLAAAAAQAQNPTPASDAPAAPRDAVSQDTATHEGTAQADAKDEKSANPHCVRETGTRIAPRDRKGRCVAGRSYSKEDIDRTGETNLAEALRKLDPAIR